MMSVRYLVLCLLILVSITTSAHAAKHNKKRITVVTNELITTSNPIGLSSFVAYVVDQNNGEVLYERNAQQVAPIASITKLMTSFVVLEAKQSMDETLTITQDDVDTVKHTGSRLAVGTQLTRRQLLQLALMSSENRATHALCRNYPGGTEACISAMNDQARLLGMVDTKYVEPTGLSFQNKSSAKDLAILVKAAYESPELREYSTTAERDVDVNGKIMKFRNTNVLVRKPDWRIGLQKTGFINEAGRCLVMQVDFMGRQLIMVFLRSQKPGGRTADAEKLRRWLGNHLVK